MKEDRVLRTGQGAGRLFSAPSLIAVMRQPAQTFRF